MQRRHFLQTVGGAALWTMARGAVAPTAAGRRQPLGFDSFSLYGLGWKAPRMIDYTAELKLDIVQLTRENFESFEEPYLRQLKAQADRLGVQLEPGLGCFCPKARGWNARQGDPAAYLRDCIRIARTLGASCFKVFMASSADRQTGTSVDELIAASIPPLRAVRDDAVAAGVKVAIENHADMQARELKYLIEAAGPEVAACCFDSGNPVMLAEDPLRALEILAPHVVTSHMRDSAVCLRPDGVEVQWVALGDGCVDLPRLAAYFREHCPQATFQLEILTGLRPAVLHVFDDEFWSKYPRMPAEDLARFLALARQGAPFKGEMLYGPADKASPEKQAALVAQRKRDLERSLEYARRELGFGRRSA